MNQSFLQSETFKKIQSQLTSPTLSKLQRQFSGPQYRGVGRVVLVFAGLTLLTLWVIQPPASTTASTPQAEPARTPSTGVRPNAGLRRSQPEIADGSEEAGTPAASPPRTNGSERAERPEPSAPLAPASMPPSAPAAPVAAASPPIAPPAEVPPPPPPAPPQLVSIATGGESRFAVIRYDNRTQTVATSDRIGPWQVSQIRPDQVILQQGSKQLILSFSRTGNLPPPPANASGSEPGSSGRRPLTPGAFPPGANTPTPSPPEEEVQQQVIPPQPAPEPSNPEQPQQQPGQQPGQQPQEQETDAVRPDSNR
ncbi:hypothetical protein [Gloeobacter morelensis]|uniref:Type II secretion system protein GspC N-terminal domain-containing protein n=1 Tax=Gloeobacter morelensis MG652769 TaxID=2781736 RepID=A0ABY3PJK8_9CYAN|nr:hypothetical protein [Gloeobacter morelensis]UFP93823.1 hypothetical protein ISF26_18900 [Gloeobacter morelensis MG652769]